MSFQKQRKPFKPPRPVASSSGGKDSAPVDRADKQAKRSPQLALSSSSPEPGAGLPAHKANSMLVDVSDDSSEGISKPKRKRKENDQEPAEPVISPKLLSALLHEHFEQGDTKITAEAMAVFRKYIELFVMEAVGRANEERDAIAQQNNSKGNAKGQARSGDFLEVEDLEKLAPQLLLDF